MAIFITVKSSIESMGAKSTGSADEYALAKKLAIIVASDFICWVIIYHNIFICLLTCVVTHINILSHIDML